MDTVSSPEQIAVSFELTPEEMQDLVKVYAANPVFRSAEAAELVVTDNPYRRPVRPEDLGFLDYRVPLTEKQVLNLRALIAHRMLRNIYEAELLLLPKGDDPAIWQDFDLFYSQKNKLQGERVRSFLENHVFTFLGENSTAPVRTSAQALKEEIIAAQQRAETALNQRVDTILAAHDRQRVATTYLIQLLGAYRGEGAALARGLAGDYDGSVGGSLSFLFEPSATHGAPAAMRSGLLKQLVRSCGLHDEPHAYWQFYLTSSLAVANYSYHLVRDPSKFFQAVGARVYREVHFACSRERQAEMLRTIFGSTVDTRYFDLPAARAQEVIDALVTPLVEQYGERALNDIAHGFQDYQRLHEIADNDFITQVTWADQPDLYRERAQIIYNAIRERNLQVPLDTFVELSSETSTTHTHDLHRLLVIESGEMHFWSLSGPPTLFRPGDITLIPRQRLHGSTVISDQCTYHQPVISSSLMRELETLF
jgi:quercetin dioxygenase-like cupin family protein